MHKFIKEFASIAISKDGPQPPHLYHYTNQNGLIGILKYQEIWASNCQYLNDEQELVLATNLARQHVKQIVKTTTGPAKLARLEQMHGRILGLEWMKIFVTSFCRDGDLLSQWRGYGGQNAGFSIEFSAQRLEQVVLQNGFYLLPCVYDQAQQISAIHRLVELYADKPDEAVSKFVDILGVIGAMMKHPAFDQEQEWRMISPPNHANSPDLVKLDPKRADFRAGVSTVTPFYKIPLKAADGRYPIDGFIVGPTPHKLLASRAVSMLNMSTLAQGGGYRPSRIPYRTW